MTPFTFAIGEALSLIPFVWHCNPVEGAPLLEYTVAKDNNGTSELSSAVNRFGRYTLPTYYQTLASSHQSYLTYQRSDNYNSHDRNDTRRSPYFMELIAFLIVLSLFILYKSIKRWYQFRSNVTPDRRARDGGPPRGPQSSQHSVDVFPRPAREPNVRDTASALSEQGLPSYEEVTKSQEALPSYDEALTHPVSPPDRDATKSVGSAVDVDDRVQVFTIPVRIAAGSDVPVQDSDANLGRSTPSGISERPIVQ
ncbi:hypothetical protein RvY_17264 [Ramazzottius varieornatus]|uniref:Uncharacterized protein n=1 Tax=Ramazzottius varieornatus TaxID=947166 RepID=A0A1D1W8N1_RAMVA|nr:hypothetical protein RvY_17264 [Ramazzottius varieornatus]